MVPGNGFGIGFGMILTFFDEGSQALVEFYVLGRGLALENIPSLWRKFRGLYRPKARAKIGHLRFISTLYFCHNSRNFCHSKSTPNSHPNPRCVLPFSLDVCFGFSGLELRPCQAMAGLA